MATSFKEYHAQNNPGNYVSVDVTGLPTQLVAGLPGIINTSPHITLMYSKESAVPLEHVQFILKRRQNVIGTQVKVIGADVFDSVPKDGERDVTQGCIVLKINDPQLTAIHNHLVAYGMKHSYPEFSAHATLIYDLDIGQCREALPVIQRAVDSGEVYLTLTKFNNERIVEDWAEKL